MLRYFIHIVFVVLSCHVEAQVIRVVVDASGHGDYRTVQEAINSLPEDVPAPRVIFIRKGMYHEKVFILASAPCAPNATGINPHWVFRDKWDPEKEAQQ